MLSGTAFAGSFIFSGILFPLLNGRQSTGGKYFPVTFQGEIPGVLQSVSALVRNQYSLGYVPTNTRQEGKRRKIQVKVNLGDQIDPKLVVVQHRQSYVELKPGEKK